MIEQFKNLVLDSILTDEIDGVELMSDEQLLQFVYQQFTKELGFKINVVGKLLAFEEWVQSIPRWIHIPTYVEDILAWAKEEKIVIKNEQKFLQDFYLNYSEAFFKLANIKY